MTIKVVRGNPTPEELAAALGGGPRARRGGGRRAARRARPRAAWSDPARIAGRRLPQPGPTAWARTYWPAA
ncbi:acyl-CoA carboxylase epsilon subunit [Streptomyces hirsutus]